MFLPLKDLNPTGRRPVVTITIIAINVVVFLYELSLGRRLPAFIGAYGVTPFEITHWTDLVGSVPGTQVVHAPGPSFIPLTLVTSMFLHGGVMHIVGNMLYLWIFGNNVEDVLGPVKFVFFYLGCGLVAAAAQIAATPGSMIPTVGASGAVAGILGAYVIAFPRARVLTLVFLGIFIQVMALPAQLLLIFWFVIQSFQGFLSISRSELSGGVAWFAHVGGFIMGAVGIRLLAPRQLRALRRLRQLD